MVVGVLTTSYPRTPDDPGGAFVRDRVRALAGTGAEVEVLAAGHGDTWARDPGVRVIAVPAAPMLFGGAGAPEALEAGGAAVWVAALEFSARLANMAATRAPSWSAIESHWLLPCALVASTVASGKIHRAFVHGGDVGLLERLWAGDAIARFLLGSGAELVFVSESLRGRFAGLGGVAPAALAERTSVCAAPVDESIFQPRPAARRRAARRRMMRGAMMDTHKLVLGVGRLVPIKGYDLLIRAVARLPLHDRPAVVIIGEGPERERLEHLAASRDVTLHLPGRASRAAVVDWLAAADVFVHPARVLPSGRVEGMPLAPREALATGMVVVASTCSGLQELEPREGLLLVPPEDPAALAQVLATHT